MNINQIIQQLENKGFKNYGDFAHPDKIEYNGINQIYFTCTSGEFNGDVAEIWYNYKTGEIVNKFTYSQFNNCQPKFKF